MRGSKELEKPSSAIPESKEGEGRGRRGPRSYWVRDWLREEGEMAAAIAVENDMGARVGLYDSGAKLLVTFRCIKLHYAPLSPPAHLDAAN